MMIMHEMIDTTVLLYDLPIFSKGKRELLALMYLRLNQRKKLLKVATPNPEQVVQSRRNTQFLDNLNHFDLLLPDGQGLVVASRILSGRGSVTPLKERISGREVVADLLVMAEEQNLKILVVGGRNYDGEKIDTNLVNSKRSIELSQSIEPIQKNSDSTFYLDWLPGYEQVSYPKETEEEFIKKILKQVKPDIVFVAFGAPYQEEWIIRHAQFLEECGVRVAMAVGGSFDYLLGNVTQVPAWVSRFGFEWLFRLVTQPWRWRRQLRLFAFIFLTFRTFINSK